MMDTHTPSGAHGRKWIRTVLPWLVIPVALILACNVAPGVQPLTHTAESTHVIASVQAPGSVASATAAPTVQPAAASPSCKVQQSLNLRSGPGTAYDPPLASLDAGTELIPTAFDPQGTSGGSWVQVQVPARNTSGWVSAGSQYISCNIDLTSLPSASASLPPPPSQPIVSAGAPDGNNLDLFRYKLDFNPDYLLRFYVFSSDDPKEIFAAKKDGRGIVSVEFKITSPNGDETYYERTEKNPGYCIFGGGKPDCSPWMVEGGHYEWKAGGKAVKSGKYGLTITVTDKNGDEANWLWNSGSHNPITINVP